MKTSSAKAKGRRCAAAVKELLELYAPDLKPDDIRITSSGSTGEDVLLSPAAQAVYPICIECKNVEKINIWEAYKQAISHLKKEDHRYPVVFFTRNHSDLMVTMKADHLMKLMR